MGFMTNCLGRSRVVQAITAAALFTTTVAITPLAVGQDGLAPSRSSSAATLTDGSQPVLTVTLGSVNKLMSDVSYVTELAGQGQAGAFFSVAANSYTQGMDLDQPIGLVVPMVAGAPQPILIVPTTDVTPLLKRLEAITGSPYDELDDGTFVVTVNANTVYVKQNANHAVASQNKDALALAPDNTNGLFQGMGNQYDVAVRLKVQQIPLQIRNILIAQMRQGFESAMAQQPNGQGTREVAEGSIQQLEQLIEEADELNVGINVDQSARQIAADFSFTATGGSELAAIYGGQQSIPSRFAAVIQDRAAAYVHSATSIGPEAISLASENLQNSLGMVKAAIANEGNMPEDQRREVEQYIDRLGQIVTASLAEGKSDFGLMVMAGTDQFQAVLGSFVADGNEVAALAKDLSTKVPDSPDAPTFKFDMGNYGGVTMHMIEGDVPPNEDEARKLFGDKIQIRIGTAPKAVYVAVGKGSGELLKKFIDSGKSDNGGQRPLAQLNGRLLPFLELAQSVESNSDVEAVINSLRASQDKGAVSFTSHSIPNGSSGKLRIGEGLIKAIGDATAARQQARQGF